ncbi:MAG TPA: helix-turn-helix transcriptional regulator [Rubrivivax sp.]|nr:helix-turn-helix transcriptional regulator [Rubrivivax sp.]
MILSRHESAALARVFALLAEGLDEREVRLEVGRALLELMHADQFASYVWDEALGRFHDGVALHMAPGNLARYEQWYQFRDPITFVLQARRHATPVSAVMPHHELARTEFFNDFLARDGLHWGINLHAFDAAGCGRALGDLRIWRARHRREFDSHDKALLDLVEPAFIGALRRAWLRQSMAAAVAAAPAPDPAAASARACTLSPRELDVARRVARGLTDKTIARELGISVSSVRTYLRRLAGKSGAQRRAGVAALVGSAAAATPRRPQ